MAADLGMGLLDDVFFLERQPDSMEIRCVEDSEDPTESSEKLQHGILNSYIFSGFFFQQLLRLFAKNNCGMEL